MSAIATKTHVLASSVVDAANFTTAYPTGITQAMLLGSTGGVVVVEQAVHLQGAGGFTVAFGGGDITITNDSDYTWPAGAELILSFGDTTKDGSYNPGTRVRGVTALTAATGTASDTIADAGSAFDQATLNNNFKSLSDKLNAVIAALAASGVTNG